MRAYEQNAMGWVATALCHTSVFDVDLQHDNIRNSVSTAQALGFIRMMMMTVVVTIPLRMGDKPEKQNRDRWKGGPLGGNGK
jgi:hypothetical protein